MNLIKEAIETYAAKWAKREGKMLHVSKNSKQNACTRKTTESPHLGLSIGIDIRHCQILQS